MFKTSYIHSHAHCDVNGLGEDMSDVVPVKVLQRQIKSEDGESEG